MKERQGHVGPQGVGAVAIMLRHSRRLLLTLALLVGAGAVAAVLTPTVPPTYCTNGLTACFDTLDKAEASMRNAPAFAGVGELLEHMQTIKWNATTLRMQYRLRDRPADAVRAPSYYAVYGTLGNSLGMCPLGDDQTALPGWCADEQALVDVGLARIQQSWAASGCTITSNVVTDDYEVPNLESSATTYGNVNYGHLNYKTTGTCANGSTINHNWDIRKRQPLYCRQGFGAISTDGIDVTTLTTANVCEADNDDVPYIAMPILQCATCAGSRHPVYPATGEKQRAEPDFTFAGQTFTRYYRSIRQFRNDSSFAVAWNHSWSDRIIGGAVTATPYVHIDEIGNYEGYTLLSGSRYRGETSVDRVLERINANGISFQLRMPDGEVREFDTSGYLIAIRNPNDPLNDIAITYNADKAMSTVTDAQGRVLRFEYADNLLQRIVLPDGTDVAYDYDANLNLTAVTYPGGATKQYHYNEPGLAGDADQRHHLTGITSEDGERFASFGYDARGRVTSSRVLGTPNELTTVSYPTEDSAMISTAEGGTRAYTIAPGTYRRILATQEGTVTAQQTYDAEGRLQSQTDKRGIRTEYGYDGAYRTSIVSAVGTPDERRQEFIHDPISGRVIEKRAKDGDGVIVARSQWTYNSRSQVTGSIVHNPVTGDSRAITTAYCESADVAAARCPIVGLIMVVDGPRSGTADAITYTYRMTDDAACASSPAACAYRKGDLWKVTNTLGQVVEILRNDGMGRALSSRDVNGVRTDVEYDPRGRVLARKVRGIDDAAEYDDQITRIEYEATGAVRLVAMPDGVTTRYEYDAAQRMSSIIDSDGNRMRFVFNAAGERVREDVQGDNGTVLRTLSRTYDVLGRLYQQFDAEQRASTYLHDNEGNLTLATDANNRKTSYEYDALGRLRSTLEDLDGVAARTQHAYDALGRITEVLDPDGLSTTYEYNGFGNLVRQQSPDTGVTNMTYDEVGSVKTRTDERGIVATFGYDALNRLTTVAYPDNSRNVSFSYDTSPSECPSAQRFHVGRVARMTDASGTTIYCYDRFGYPTSKLQITQGRSYTVGYDRAPPAGSTGSGVLLRPRPADGHLYGVTYPDGTHVNISRNAQRQPSAITVTLASGQTQTLLSGAVYYPFGAVSQWTYGNGRVIRRSRNQNYEPGFIEDSSPGGISIGYWFDPAGNLESLRRADQTDPARRKYRYDGLNRLTEVRDGGTNAALQGYVYDKTGNRTRRTDGLIDQDYIYMPGKHWLGSVAGVARQYNDAGSTTRIGAGSQAIPPGGCANCPEENPDSGDPGHPGPGNPPPREAQGIASIASSTAVTESTVREFEYDNANRMRAVKHDGVVAMSYLYNGKGERVYRTGSGQSVTTLYDEVGRWLGDYDAVGQPFQQAIWMGDLPVGLLVGAGANQKLYYVQADALGTPRVVIDPVRNVAVWNWEIAGEAFGDGAPNQDADGDGVAFVFDMRFPGQRYDSATGMYYNYHRDYDSGAGRYVQSDPIGLGGGSSTFGYVGGNPLKRIDPKGLVDAPLELYAAGVTDRMPNRVLFPPEQPLEKGPPDELQVDMICSPNCEPGKQRFDTHEAAARNIIAQVLERSTEIDKEVCGLICQDNFSGKYFLAKETWWLSTKCPPGYKQCPNCGRPAAWWHTHGAPESFLFPGRAEYFSPEDMGVTNETGLPGYLGTPQGSFMFYSPGAPRATYLGSFK
jgi:RHS repeat-associated protein